MPDYKQIKCEGPLDLLTVLSEELELMRGFKSESVGHKTEKTVKAQKTSTSKPPPGTSNSPKDLTSVFKALRHENLSALCFSGGGIRSATFGLGLVEVLADYGLLDKFDYLSTVSGGGYFGSWLSAWVRREQLDIIPAKVRKDDASGQDTEKKLFDEFNKFQDSGVKAVQAKLKRNVTSDPESFNPGTEPKQLQFLREYSSYMTPNVGLLSADSWTFIGIYLRNLLLNWTIFIPLIASLLLIPRILVEIIKYSSASSSTIQILSVAAILAGGLSIFIVIRSIPSANTEVDKPAWSSDGGVVCLAVFPLALMAICVTTLVFWHKPEDGRFDFFPLNSDYTAYYLVGFPAAIYLVLKLIVVVLGLFKFTRSRDRRHTLKEFWRRLDLFRLLWVTCSAAIASIVGGLLVQILLNPFLASVTTVPLIENGDGPKFYICFAVPLLLLIFAVAATIFVGAASKAETDGDREWFARLGSWILIVCLGWIFFAAIVLWGPSAIKFLYHITMSTEISVTTYDKLKAQIVPLIGIFSGVLSLFGGFSGLSKVGSVPPQDRVTKFLSYAPQIATIVFIAFILAGISALTFAAQSLFGDALSMTVNSGFIRWTGMQAPSAKLFPVVFFLIYGIVLSLISLVMACLVNVNTFSLHGAYRDRLIRAFLGASKVKRKADPFTGFDDADNFQLHRLKGQRPFHIINATLNLVDGENLAWQNRKPASFMMSPLHCGNWELKGYRRTFEYSRNTDLGVCQSRRYCNRPDAPCNLPDQPCQLPGKSLRLGTAMAISGVAANPNMGYYSSPIVMFLMAMFNIRLGWWLGNTNKRGDKTLRGTPYYTKPGPTISILPLISETLGRTDVDRLFINISDGGHFENLGLYEMVLRRCKFIVLSDASPDEAFAFDDLSNAIEKCKIDLGVDIEFGDDINNMAVCNDNGGDGSNQRYAVGKIKYPENAEEEGEELDGLLLYIKPTRKGDEPIGIKHYVKANPTFPHQSSLDQLFDENQFEAYRELGFITMSEILSVIKDKKGDLATLFNSLRMP